MSVYSIRQYCASCSFEVSEHDAVVICPSCGGLLEIRHPTPTQSGGMLRAAWDMRWRAAAGQTTPESSGVWRYHEAVLPVPLGTVVSHPEGNTPLLQRDHISAWTGVSHLWMKHEGHNPTGSFKDRGMTVAVTQARRVAARGVICASTGNTSSSLASYAAQAGLAAIVLIPSGQVAAGKLTQTQAYGARTIQVRGDFDACLRLVREASAQLDLYLVNSLNPFRLEGQKTIVFELLQQLAWQVPDWIVLPGGNLGNTAAVGKALRELYAWGVIDRLPRVGVVQAEGAAPFVASFESQFLTRHRVIARTVASAIKIGDPASYDRAVRVLRETNGIALAVSDSEILAAKSAIDTAGVGCEPASAASLAGVRTLRMLGHIHPEALVVAVLTGHLLKDPKPTTTDDQHGTSTAHTPPFPEIDPTVSALASVLAREDASSGEIS